MQQLVEQVVQWAGDKGILNGATREGQMLKTVEETGELAKAIGADDTPEIIDAIGDIAVTLIIQAELNGLEFENCLQSAYDVISKRTGKMENGLFVKDE